MKKLKCAVIGCGGLGKGHIKNLQSNPRAELVALCDIDPEQFTKVVSTNLGQSDAPAELACYRLYTDAEKLLESESLDFVVIALPTYLHEPYTIMALDKGVHVFCEKPMARTWEGCRNMVDAARRNGRQLMIGQCLRFDAAYRTIKDAYEQNTYGKLLRLELTRYSLPPIWGHNNWFMDFARSGGAAMDLHVHDVDFINWLLGRPDSVRSDAIHVRSGFDCLSTRYYYKDGPVVTATGDWSLPESYGFHPGYLAVFEQAAITQDPLGPVVYTGSKEIRPEQLGSGNKYYDEVDHFIDCIESNTASTLMSMESTMQSIEIVTAEMRSADTGDAVPL